MSDEWAAPQEPPIDGRQAGKDQGHTRKAVPSRALTQESRTEA